MKPLEKFTWPNPKRRVTEHAHPLARRFFELAAESKTAIRDIAYLAGLCHVTIGKWKDRHAPNVTSLEAALNVLGYELVIREKREPKAKREEPALK